MYCNGALYTADYHYDGVLKNSNIQALACNIESGYFEYAVE